MSNQYFLRNLWRCFIILVSILAGQAISKNEEIATTTNSGLAKPPKFNYTIECSFDTAEGFFEGTEIIRFRNTTSEPMSRFELRWTPGGNLEISSNDREIKTDNSSDSSSRSIEFSEPILPGESGDLQIKFDISAPGYKGIDKIVTSRWCPYLWRGFEAHDDYKVKISMPEEYTVATSGLLNKKTGYYHAEDVRSFGLFAGKGFDSIEASAGDVRVRCIFAPNGKKCAELLLKTAVDAVNFYRERFGFYPSKCLTIIPGMNRPAGGYPVATNIVAVHGMGQLDSMPKFHWQWITAHEIGHQYCGEYMLGNDPTDAFDWLMIGLGIYADREYTQARNLSSAKHQGFMDRYMGGVRAGYDTTINITPKQRSKIKFDYNNVVKHGKSYSVISALDCVLGKETFSRIYQRCLKEFGGRRLDVSGFQTVCQEEAGQNLEWFFEQWINSNKFLSYEVSSKKCEKKKNWYFSKVEVKRTGDLKMPIPVAVYFEDGTSQIKLTDRLQDINILKFKSKSLLKEVKLDPEEALAFIPVTKPAPIGPAEFEILDTEFEPIHQGKNIVWVTVENKSDKEKFLGVGIYSRSVDYGPNGMGWGKTFYEKFDAGQTKKSRYVYKIQGPVTKNTYTRLSFYNAGSLRHEDNKDLQPFTKKKYSINDLKVYHSDKAEISAPSQEQFETISQAFVEIQQYIHRSDYKQAWDLFTEDYQKVEFHNDFDKFREGIDGGSMFSVFVWNRAEFLDLAPVSITKRKELFTLTASNQPESWTIDFILVNDKWKIDWIDGYTPGLLKGHWSNWQERLLPTMQKHVTEHFDIYYFKDSTAEKEIDQIAEQREKGFTEICGFLGKDSNVRITMVFFENGKIKTLETGHQGAGWAYGNTIVEIYNDKEKLNPYHEIAHILMGPIGNPPALFNEGFAVYISERLGSHALKSSGGGDSSLYQRVSELKSKNDWIELETLMSYTEIGSTKSRPTVAYPEAGAFVKFLVETFGKDKFLKTYKILENSHNKTVQQKNFELLEQIYGGSLQQLEKKWEDAFSKSQ